MQPTVFLHWGGFLSQQKKKAGHRPKIPKSMAQQKLFDCNGNAMYHYRCIQAAIGWLFSCLSCPIPEFRSVFLMVLIVCSESPKLSQKARIYICK